MDQSRRTIECPACRNPMSPGRLEILHFELLRESELRFKDARGGEAFVADLEQEAFRCDGCQTIALVGPRPEELLCFECGALIPPDASACPSCGWRWSGDRGVSTEYHRP